VWYFFFNDTATTEIYTIARRQRQNVYKRQSMAIFLANGQACKLGEYGQIFP